MDSQILDKKQALAQAGNNEGLAKDLFTMLLKELPVLHQLIQEACQKQQRQAMWDHAHKLYGSTAYCGVPRLRETARELEDCIKAEDDNCLTPLLEKLDGAIQELMAQGETLLKESWS